MDNTNPDDKDNAVDYNNQADDEAGVWFQPDMMVPEICVRKEVVLYYQNVIFFNRSAAHALYTDQNLLQTVQDLEHLSKDDVNKVCQVIKKNYKTMISIMATK